MTRKIAATMASQHPDHANIPFWHKEAFISTRYETEELLLAFSELGIDEYKWDWEGKLVDENVTERLFSEHFDYFNKHQLGVDKFITFRLPNPKVETEVRLGRAFMGILSASVLAKKINFHSPPFFEVILPMTKTAEEIIFIQEAFHELATLKHTLYMFGESTLKEIEVIPLFEDVQTIMNSHKILEKYLELRKLKFHAAPTLLRPYVARSDPALNSGLIPTVLAIKIALSHYKTFEQKHNIALFPIIGAASLPFRGGITPLTAVTFANEYRGIRTALIQSAFRYDYEKSDVIKGIATLKELLPKQTAVTVDAVDQIMIQECIPHFETFYRSSIEHIAPIINDIANYLPRRRERVQHTGLFGYSRGVGDVKLPRAIGFTAALYSLGIPPEIIGTGRGLAFAKQQGKIDIIEKYYKNIKNDLLRAGRFLNKTVLQSLMAKDSSWNAIHEDVKAIEKYLGFSLAPESQEEKEHHKIVEKIYCSLNDKDKTAVKEYIQDAAVLRRSLG